MAYALVYTTASATGGGVHHSERLTEAPVYREHGVSVTVRYTVNDKTTDFKTEYRTESRFYPYAAFLYVTTEES